MLNFTVSFPIQEREDTTELLILPHYSWWGQSISFIKKRLDSTGPFLIHSLYTHRSPGYKEPHEYIFFLGMYVKCYCEGHGQGSSVSPTPNPNTFS